MSVGHRSYSQVTSYLSCPKSYQLARIVKVPETPAWYLAAGSAVHACLEAITKDPKQRGESLLPLWTTSFAEEIESLENRGGVNRTEWRTGGRKTKDRPNAEDYGFWIDEGLRQIQVFSQWFDDRIAEGWSVPTFAGNLACEIELNVDFGGVRIKGYADLIMELPSGELMVIDHKTGARTPDTFQQLALYAFAMEKLSLPTPTLGAFFMTRKGELSIPTTFRQTDLDSLTDTIVNVDRAIKAELFPARVTSMCKGCGVANYCVAVNGSLAKEFDPIYTNKEGK
jgi:putative RecB family exonuclease